MEVKFEIRDETGHSTILVPQAEVEERAQSYREQGYMTVVNGMLVPKGTLIPETPLVELYPLPTAG